jgi:diacylglycerol diphosphate phosphatase/phosphatidate phosphatase
MIKGLEIALDIFCTLLLLLLGWILTSLAHMLNRYVNLNDDYYQPIPADEPRWVMIIFLWLIPVTYLTIFHLIMRRNWRNTILVLISWFNTLALAIFFTALFRYFLPEPRPYFATKCGNTRTAGYMLDPSFCTQALLRHDMQSFPSGHTSLVWTSWVFVLLVLSYISGTFSGTGGFWKILLFFLAPLVVPIWMSCDRVRTGNHFLSDVLIGTLLGIFVAFVSFFNMDTNRLM